MSNMDFSPTPINRSDIEMRGAWGGVVNYRSNKVAIFHHFAVHNPQKSAEAGTPIYDDKIFVKIMEPGNSLEIVDREVTEIDKRNWPMQWNQFVQSLEQVPDGTPLDVLFPTSPGTCHTLKANNIHTVEQLAELSAHAIGTIMGGQDFNNKAKAYLDKAQRGVQLHQFEKELSSRDREISTLKRQLEQAMDAINELRERTTQNAGVAYGGPSAIAGRSVRPIYPQPRPPEAQRFDAQSAQIGALDKERRGRPRKSRVQE
jgi:hypothetical protein